MNNNQWLDFYNVYSIAKKVEKKSKKEETCKCDCCNDSLEKENYEQYCDEHIIEQPDIVTTEQDAVIAAKITDDEFNSVLGKLPDCEPCVRPENDAELTPVEMEVLKTKITPRKKSEKKQEKTKETEKKVAKRGRPKTKK